MSRIRFACLAVGLLLSTTVASAQAPSHRPNIVLFIADDLGYGELGCYGARSAPTAEIDRLAAEGVRYTSGYVTAPFCAASRAGLLTGRYQTRFGFEFNPIGAQNDDPQIGLPRSEITIADQLRDAGYATGLLGKWHLGGTANYHPQRRGFDEFFGFLHEGHYYVPPPWPGVTTWLRRKALPDGGQGRWMSADGHVYWTTHMGHREPDYDANNPILRNSQPVQEATYFTEALTREAVDFIQRHHEQPFFLCVAYSAVHSPMQALNADIAAFSEVDDPHRRIFLAMLASLDRSVGTILDQLEQTKLTSKTLVIFLSDNGGPTRELTSSNAPLRGEKGGLYEGGIRVPMVLRWPGRVPAGTVETRPVISLDLTATMVQAAGLTSRPQVDGHNLVSTFSESDAGNPQRALFWRVGKRAAIRQGGWKLVRNGNSNSSWELYDLNQDVGEQRDLIKDHTHIAEDLQARWEQWNSDQREPLW